MVDFPEQAHRNFHFLNIREAKIMVARIQHDRGDVLPSVFSWPEVFRHFLDPKLYGFCALFFILVRAMTRPCYLRDLPIGRTSSPPPWLTSYPSCQSIRKVVSAICSQSSQTPERLALFRRQVDPISFPRESPRR